MLAAIEFINRPHAPKVLGVGYQLRLIHHHVVGVAQHSPLCGVVDRRGGELTIVIDLDLVVVEDRPGRQAGIGPVKTRRPVIHQLAGQGKNEGRNAGWISRSKAASL